MYDVPRSTDDSVNFSELGGSISPAFHSKTVLDMIIQVKTETEEATERMWALNALIWGSENEDNVPTLVETLTLYILCCLGTSKLQIQNLLAYLLNKMRTLKIEITYRNINKAMSTPERI